MKAAQIVKIFKNQEREIFKKEKHSFLSKDHKNKKRKMKLIILKIISVQWLFEEIHIIYIYFVYHLKFAVLEDNTFAF